MEITKSHLEAKLKTFRDEHAKAVSITNQHLELSKKLEGAIESVMILLSELEPKPEAIPEVKPKPKK